MCLFRLHVSKLNSIINPEKRECYPQKQSSGGVLWKGIPKKFAKFTGKHLCQSPFFNKVVGLRPAKACNFIKKETLAQLFSCEFCNISKNIFLYRTPLVAASVSSQFS